MYQGGLEISVDASEEVLTLLVHYLHTGVLPPLSASYPPLLTNNISPITNRTSPPPPPPHSPLTHSLLYSGCS
jgi:hypothetical protein